MSRRMFLSGTGQTLLAIPFLPSLLPREAQAQATSSSPLRFIMITNHGSPNERGFFGQYYETAQKLGLEMAPGNSLLTSVAHRSFAQMTGDMSYILAPFTPLKDKVTVLRGIDSMALERGAHPPSFASSATGYGGNSATTYSGQFSIDAIIAEKLKPKSVPLNKSMLNLLPNYSGSIGTAGQFNEQNGQLTGTYMLSPTYNGDPLVRAVRFRSMTRTAQILKEFFSTAGGQAELINRRGLMNSVFADYQRVRDMKNIGSEDRKRLDAFMSYIADVEEGIDYETTNAFCGAPVLENDLPYPILTKGTTESVADFVARQKAAGQAWNTSQRPLAGPILWRNHSKLIAAAFSCGMMRVASIALPQIGSHAYHHSSGLPKATPTSSADAKAYFDAQRGVAQNIANMMDILKGIPDGSGSLLDNTLIYWNQNYGTVYTPGGGHSRRNFPVVLAGGAQGKLRMGQYIDYRFQLGTETRGLPLNNLLVTVMNCFGVTATDYEFQSNTGYGTYEGLGTSMPANVTSLTGKRSLLPYLAT